SQSIPQKIPLFDNRFTLQVPLLRKRNRRLRHLGRHVPLGEVRSLPSCLHDTLGLATESFCDLSMPLLHLFVRKVGLRFARLVRSDLCSASSSLVLLRKMLFYLLAARTRRCQIFL